METNEKKQKFEFNSVSIKMFIIFVMMPILMIPLGFVASQIEDRREYETVAQNEVAKGWGQEVEVHSPVVVTSGYSIQPSLSETSIKVDSKEKKRGIFHVPVYTATLNTKVTFAKPDSQKFTETENKKMSVAEYLIISVKPISSIQSFKIKESGSTKELKAQLVNEGIRLDISELSHKDIYERSLEIEITSRGTHPLTYATNADQDQVKMSGNWIKPKFTEDILPSETTVSEKGFEASWTLNALPKWENGTRELKTIGLTHLWIGTDYTKIERSVKYGILFIALTFLLIFLVESMGKIKIHPLQYALIGLSIGIFYLLLLAFSETIGFDFAYIISSAMVTGLIVFYIRGFLNQKKFVSIILAEQLVLSTFFYTLLSLEETAFLIGTIGLFIALAAIMTITRKFDWYSGTFKNQIEA